MFLLFGGLFFEELGEFWSELKGELLRELLKDRSCRLVGRLR